ncbi:LOW QUALITY PROTEIN: uncharacterized protein Dwil_GK12999 [Drosophila willistoni]|uniref:Ig-like domain-containing protein n=1 Tax=Drosophila willistoni TaxID=7260 RepID=B4N3L2_DROWI|nr:LOW QUALITY PROTEIN: uncharacterized protein Dwil_GK12999 [Drosophila willistoni]
MLLRRLQQISNGGNKTLIGFQWNPKGLLLLLFSLAIAIGQSTAQIDRTISEHESKNVVLPCPVNEQKCGKLHSLNWFKGDGRIAAMLLGDSNVTSVNKEFENRVTVEQNPYRLVIKDLKISDEDIYLCDTTFYIPEETCDNFNGYRVELRVLVPPTEVVILDAKGDRIENGSIVGPLQERQSLKATCTVKNTRPQPDVGWFRGTKRLATYSPTHDLKDGLYTSTLELDWQLSREDLAQDIECRVESAAIKNAIVTKFSVDLQVRPTSIDINGVEHHTVQGSKVVLTCDIHGARPAVNLTWYNATSIINPEENELTEIRTKAFEKEDGTYHTQSELIFNATRFENVRVFRCEAENIVLQINREKAISSAMTLEVLYPPVVRVNPPELVVNTSEIILLNCEYISNPASLTEVIWYRNNETVNVNDTDHYQGGNSDNVALVIKSTRKEDIGNYTCELSNAIGKGSSDQLIDLDVQYVPRVEVLMIPEGPVKESDESNVTLFCNIIDANPSMLTKVRWYANSTLLKELPDCEETREDLCHIDPSKLLLESIGRGFFYNYSCEGLNAAGWGPRSEEKELMVHYEPGPATLTHFPPIAVKKKSVIFSCSVDDPGYPESNRYRWLRGGRGPLQDIVTKDWTVEPVGLDSRTNYSCYAYNEGGKGVMATVNLEVHAPPFFIKNLSPYTGMLHSSANANLTCRIECVPRCEISWLKDGVPIEKNDTRYFVKEKYMDASPATGDFESMLSVLHFNMSNWPNKKFDIEADNANYSCVSTSNSVGAGIKSATYFSIEYAPDNTTVSESIVYVQEDTIPGRVICKSRANPEPSYEWRFRDQTITRGNALIINKAMQRNDNGTYTGLAFYKHGKSIAETVIDVQFKPRCEIERQEIDDQDTLICTAYGNPEEADFSWSIKAENETVESLGNGDKKASVSKSYYILQEDYAIARTYRCVANNTVGLGAFCDIEVAEQRAWWQRWDKTTLIILVAAILGLLLAVIIICCIIICICRRRRRQDKFLPQVGIALPLQDTTTNSAAAATAAAGTLLPATLLPPQQEKHEQQQQQQQQQKESLPAAENNNDELLLATPPTTIERNGGHGNIPKSPPRWPLRPGVMVHVSSDTKENLAVNRMTLKPNLSGAGQAGNASQLSAQLSAVLNDTQTTNSNSTMLTEATSSGPEATYCLESPSGIMPSASTTNSSSRVERILAFVFRRAKKSPDDGIRDSQRSHVGLLQTFWRGRGNNNDVAAAGAAAAASPFGVQHRLKGIRCSGSDKPATPATVMATATATAMATVIQDTTTTTLKSPQGATAATAPIVRVGPGVSSLERHHPKQQRSILKSPTPPPRPPPPMLPLRHGHGQQKQQQQLSTSNIPIRSRSRSNSSCSSNTITTLPPLLKRTVLVSPSSKIERVQIHDKSSSLGDPLTEPGEYENLPFHGLQTAPNKFSTTPTNFNNNTNVVRVAPRPKRLNGSISQPMNSQQQQQQQLLNAIEHDYQPTYAVVERGVPPPPPAPTSALLNTNPFLAASNFKKYDAAGEELHGSMQRGKRGKSGGIGGIGIGGGQDTDKKFYSLKFPGSNKFKKPPINSLNSSLVSNSLASSASKCKRHHSFAGGGHGDIDSSGKPMLLYDPPVYENVADNIDVDMGGGSSNLNINLATVQLHSQPSTTIATSTVGGGTVGGAAVVSHHKKKHHHRQHQQKNDIVGGGGIGVGGAAGASGGADFQLMEPERLSIYRSDSGISNSSYESHLPTTAMGGHQRAQKSHKSGNANSTAVGTSAGGINSSSGLLGRKPVYMNVEDERSGSPAHINSSYESASSTSHPGGGGISGSGGGGGVTDPTSLSSCTSLYSSGTGGTAASSSRCNRHHQQIQQQIQKQTTATDITTPEDYEQYQLGHQPAHSASMLSVASSLSVASREMLMPNELLLQATQLASTSNTVGNLRYVPPIVPPNAAHLHSHPHPLATAATAADGAYDCLVVRRPMRLPLRKHHTFHFQTTQTANGKLQQLRQQLQKEKMDHHHQRHKEGDYRPLTLNERHAFKPISPTPATTATQQQQQQQQHKHIQQQLNPAASLEALEVLTKTHPDFKFTQPRKEHSEQMIISAASAEANEEDEEDLGYSFCEEEYMVDGNGDEDRIEDDEDPYANGDTNATAPPPTPSHTNAATQQQQTAIANATAGALRYFMTQSYREPLNAANFDDEFIYADLESQHYGPINYKAASLYAQVKKNKKTGAMEELK